MIYFIIAGVGFVCMSICLCTILTVSNHRNDTYIKQCQKYVKNA